MELDVFMQGMMRDIHHWMGLPAEIFSYGRSQRSTGSWYFPPRPWTPGHLVRAQARRAA